MDEENNVFLMQEWWQRMMVMSVFQLVRLVVLTGFPWHFTETFTSDPQWMNPNDLTDLRAAMVSELNNNTSINNHLLYVSTTDAVNEGDFLLSYLLCHIKLNYVWGLDWKTGHLKGGGGYLTAPNKPCDSIPNVWRQRVNNNNNNNNNNNETIKCLKIIFSTGVLFPIMICIKF